MAFDILIVDDQPDLLRLVSRALQTQGFATRTAASGVEALDRLAEAQPDLVLLDITMPVINGMEVLRHIRTQGSTPVILVTALASVENRVLGLQLGADDYITKPFDLVELVARVHAVLRRTRGGSLRDDVIRLEGLEIDRAARSVVVRGEPVVTAAKEFDLLLFLAAAPGRVFTRDQLLHAVWDSSAGWQKSSTVTEHIRRLRQKIEVDPDKPRWLLTVRGIGYKFERRSAARVTAEDNEFREYVARLAAPLEGLRDS